jgi:hypothetical protein
LIVFLSFVFGFEGINPLYNTGGYDEMERTAMCANTRSHSEYGSQTFQWRRYFKGKIARCQYLLFNFFDRKTFRKYSLEAHPKEEENQSTKVHTVHPVILAVDKY